SVTANLVGVDPRLEEAARVLGADGWTAFRLVTLPIIRSGLVAGGLFSFIVSFDNVPVTIFLLSVRQTTLPVKIFTAVEHGVDPSIAAVSTLLILATGLILFLAERWVGLHRYV
ncbi:MAG: ABC transporter permease subunit, partial [Kiloniellales bacterium]|nr:ABC transporter permease subunit [Kiloniellales bacterium]